MPEVQSSDVTEARAIVAPERVLAEARAWLGTPYRHQASLIGVGCDCLGLLRGIWRGLIGPEPEPRPAYGPAWAETHPGEPLLEAARRHLIPCEDARPEAGRILIFRWREGVSAKHCGIAAGPETFIHAHDGASVAEVALIPSWRRRIIAAFCFPDPSVRRTHDLGE